MRMDRPIPEFLTRSALDSIEERELDLLLLTELHGSPDFRQFVVQKATGRAEQAFQGAWRSVFDSLGETDVLLLSDVEGIGRVAFMIEDKIDAVFQDRQAERYRARGAAGVAEGAWDTFRTCLCAPALFIEPYRALGEWDCFLTLEDIIAWLDSRLLNDARGAFFSAALTRATGKFTKGGFVADERASAFWQAYQAFCLRTYPDVELAPLRPVQSKNPPWPRFAVSRLPSDVRLEYKSWKGHVDLTLNERPIDAMRALIGHLCDPPIILQPAGGSTALRLVVPILNHLESFAGQEESAHMSFRAVQALLRQWPTIRNVVSGPQIQESSALRTVEPSVA
jgi:hypothetical protein